MSQDLATPTTICGICGSNHKSDKCDFLTVKKHVPDRIVPSRAKLTLPEFLKLELLTDGTYSVKTLKSIEKGTQFGPLIAERNLTLNPASTYVLKIFTGEQSPIYLDCTNESACNWLSFLTAAEFADDQNMLCYQDDNSIYYIASRNIEPGETLRVWYAPYYCSKIGKEPLAERNKQEPLKDWDIDVDSLIKKQQNIMERKMWTCKFCGQVEQNIVSFAKHMLIHYSVQRKKQCEICNIFFAKEISLKNHLKTVHPTDTSGLINLPDDNHQIMLRNNSIIPNDQLNLGGPMLNDLFTDSADLPETDLNEFELNLDNQNVLLENDNLNGNLKDFEQFNFELDENQKTYVCDICLKQFHQLKYLMIHMRSHTGEYVCIICTKVYCRKESLETHRCNNLTEVMCAVCDKQFHHKRYLARHLINVHFNRDAGNTSATCKICCKTFTKVAYLRQHMARHRKTRNTDLVCEDCGCVLRNKTTYRQHRKQHIGTHHCEICKKYFRRRDTYLTHKAVVHQENSAPQAQCNICMKKYKSIRILQTHITRSHGSQKKYPCSLCEAVFKYSGNLKVHMRKLHERNMPIIQKGTNSCQICNRKFKWKTSLRKHIRKYHRNKDLNVGDTPGIAEKENVQSTLEKSASILDNRTAIVTVHNDAENKQICLSIPDLGYKDEEIQLDNNAFILENGNIVQPQLDKVVIYLMNSDIAPI